MREEKSASKTRGVVFVWAPPYLADFPKGAKTEQIASSIGPLIFGVEVPVLEMFWMLFKVAL